MILYVSEEFILPADFEEIKERPIWCAETILPHGHIYQISYDPDVDGSTFGRGVKALALMGDPRDVEIPIELADYGFYA